MSRTKGSTNKPKGIQTMSTDVNTSSLQDAGERGKELDKNVRAPIGGESSVNKMGQADKVRMAMGKQLRLDASYYERLPEYEDMQLFWENDTDGAVEKWLHLGAELVPRKNKSLKHFKGFTDRAESEWECVPVGSTDSGQQMLAYLLFMPATDYQTLRVDPKEARNSEILDALGMGKSQAEGSVMSNVKGIKTYAPNNPVGDGKGFEQTHDA